MHYSTLLAPVLAASAFALPQGQIEDCLPVTVTSTVTVTVYVNPLATPAWAGPPRVSETPNTRRPVNAPSLPVWTPPRPDAWKTSSTLRPVVPSTSSARVTPSPTSRPGGIPSSTGGAGGVRPSSTTSRPGSPPSSSSRPAPTGPANPSSSSVRPSASTVIGNPTSAGPGTSSAAPPTSSGAPLDPGHISGVVQASLSVSSGIDYRNAILYHHNAARANHNAAPLVWNDTVAATAKITADTCIFEHSVPNGVRQGQNIFTVSGDYFNVTAAITESWYKGEFPYMRGLFGLPSIPLNLFSDVGHLTQVLWKGTTSVGCYSIDCGNRMVVGGQTSSSLNKYTVCNYWPAGNVGTLFAINVGLPISTTALGSWTD